MGAERRFYKQFISGGELAFDIGANRGDKSAALLSLGAKVVAVEPNPHCIAILRERFAEEISMGQLALLPVAIGQSDGRVKLREFAQGGTNASASDSFIAALGEELGPPIAEFDVELMAGASLFERYGVPSFIKIDVEGMDAIVLSTIPRRPRTLSFEFNLTPEVLPITEACLAEVTRLGFRQANFTRAAEPRLALEEWVRCENVLEEVGRNGRSGSLWGDIIVR